MNAGFLPIFCLFPAGRHHAKFQHVLLDNGRIHHSVQKAVSHLPWLSQSKVTVLSLRRTRPDRCAAGCDPRTRAYRLRRLRCGPSPGAAARKQAVILDRETDGKHIRWPIRQFSTVRFAVKKVGMDEGAPTLRERKLYLFSSVYIESICY